MHAPVALPVRAGRRIATDMASKPHAKRCPPIATNVPAKSAHRQMIHDLRKSEFSRANDLTLRQKGRESLNGADCALKPATSKFGVASLVVRWPLLILSNFMGRSVIETFAIL